MDVNASLGGVFTKALEMVNEFVIILSETGELLYVNQAFCVQTGVAAHTLVGKDVLETQFGERLFDANVDFLESFRAMKEFNGEVETQTAWAEPLWLFLQGCPVAQGQHTIYLVVGKDVTARKRMENESSSFIANEADYGVPIILFMDRLGQALRRAERSKGHVAVVSIGLFTDEMLCGATQEEFDAACRELLTMTKKRLRGMDTMVRLEDHEFAIILEDVTSEKSFKAVLKRIMEGLEGFQATSEVCPKTDYRMGVALYPRHAVDENELYENARNAMLAAQDHPERPFLIAEVAS